jgi:hypothetical protein
MTAHFVTYRPITDKSEPDILDRAEDLLSWKEYGRIEGWSARKNFRLVRKTFERVASLRNLRDSNTSDDANAI